MKQNIECLLSENNKKKFQMAQIKPKTNIEDLFRTAKSNGTYLKVCAPMVRYSKLEFRRLVRKFGVDLCFTPMIMTDSFCQSNKARLNEFTTSQDDTPVIAQFASNLEHEYLSAAEMIYPYVDGIDLNCGCPQSWAMRSGYGCAMLKDPELISSLTSTIRRNLPGDFSVSVKVRIQKTLSDTINLCRQLEKCGVTFLTVHGRTSSQKSTEPVNMDALREVRQSLSIPLIGNGHCKTLQDADNMFEQVGCDGVMAANGILTNPTMFAGDHKMTPIECLQDWLDIGTAANDNITFQCFHHHFSFMMEKFVKRKERAHFNSFSRKQQIFDYFEEKFDIRPRPIEVPENICCTYEESGYRDRVHALNAREKANKQYDAEASLGKFFMDKSELDGSGDEDDDDAILQTNIFDIA